MAYGVHLHLVTGTGMQVVDGQARLVGGHGALLARPIPLVVHLVAILSRVHITAPAEHQAVLDALQLLDEGRRRACVSGDVAGIGGHSLGQGLHGDQVATPRQQRVQGVLREIRGDLGFRGHGKQSWNFACVRLLVVAKGGPKMFI